MLCYTIHNHLNDDTIFTWILTADVGRLKDCFNNTTVVCCINGLFSGNRDEDVWIVFPINIC